MRLIPGYLLKSFLPYVAGIFVEHARSKLENFDFQNYFSMSKIFLYFLKNFVSNSVNMVKHLLKLLY